jgi:hypothetical protein
MAFGRNGRLGVFRIKGDHLKVQNLLRLLGKAASLELAVFAEDVNLGSGTSDRLRASLKAIIEDAHKPAQLDVNFNGDFGLFSDWQKLNVVDALGIEAGAAGMGTAIAIHEIWENYAAQNNDGTMGQYGPAHAAALEVESVVASELTERAGRRVAAVTVGAGIEKGFVLDYEDYFLVLKGKPENKRDTGRFAAEFSDRYPVESVEIAGVTAGHRVAAKLVATAVSELTQKPRATARLTGRRLANEEPDVARQRAEAVRCAIIVALGEDEYAEDEGIELSQVKSRGRGADLGVRRPWTRSVTEEADNTSVLVELFEPSDD